MTKKKSWVIIVLILGISLIIFGYFYYRHQQRLNPPSLYMEQFSLRLAETVVRGPVLWGQPLFVLAGLVVFLYTLGATFVLGGKRKLIFPLLVLAIGLGLAAIIEPIFGITKLWVMPIVLIFFIFIAAYWITRLDLSNKSNGFSS